MKKELIQKTEKIRFLGIPVGRRVYLPESIKTYLLGVRMGKRKYDIYPSPKVAEKIVEKVKVIEHNNYVIVKEGLAKELLIVNSDSIGDYVIFRNFLREIKNSEKYKDYKIVLLGSEKYKDFAEYLDSDVVDKFLWIPQRPESWSPEEMNRVKNDLFNRQGLKRYYDTIVFASFNSAPKRGSHNNILSQVMHREYIIHNDHPNPSRNCVDFLMYTHVYTNYKADTMFEFDINKGFFEDLLDKKISISYPIIENEKVELICDVIKKRNREYVVINPCAYDNYRMWHRNNWMEIIRYLRQEKGYDVLIVCSASEKAYCQQLVEDVDLDRVEVLAGLPVKHLLAVLKLAKMYIGQDSGVFHVAAALNIRALCLSAGNAYFRFMNYPKERKNIRVLFPIGTEEWINDNIKTAPSLVIPVNSYHINAIRVDKVKEAVEDLLNIKELFFIHRLRTLNTGDQEICPYDYFKDYFNQYIVQKIDIDDILMLKFKKSTFILGGGGLINQNNDWNNGITALIQNGSKVIGWGIGLNQHHGSNISASVNLNSFTLLGLRDYNQGVPYLPCVSCLKPELDMLSKRKRKVGCIVHYENRNIDLKCPTIYNNQPFSELIEFIAESDVLITNTYHMMYWATLMGKKVILFNPFSNRFDNFKYKSTIYSGNLAKDIRKAKTYPEALAECRKLNLAFFEKVKKIIEG